MIKGDFTFRLIFLLLKLIYMILWIENYSNSSDNAGFSVDTLNDAAKFATSEYQYGIKHPCNILSENGTKYKFTLINDDGKIIATKRELKAIAKKL